MLQEVNTGRYRLSNVKTGFFSRPPLSVVRDFGRTRAQDKVRPAAANPNGDKAPSKTKHQANIIASVNTLILPVVRNSTLNIAIRKNN